MTDLAGLIERLEGDADIWRRQSKNGLASYEWRAERLGRAIGVEHAIAALRALQASTGEGEG